MRGHAHIFCCEIATANETRVAESKNRIAHVAVMTFHIKPARCQKRFPSLSCWFKRKKRDTLVSFKFLPVPRSMSLIFWIWIELIPFPSYISKRKRVQTRLRFLGYLRSKRSLLACLLDGWPLDECMTLQNPSMTGEKATHLSTGTFLEMVQSRDRIVNIMWLSCKNLPCINMPIVVIKYWKVPSKTH